MTKTKLTGPQAQRLTLIERGFGSRVAILKGSKFSTPDRKLLQRGLLRYTIQTKYGGLRKYLWRERVLRLTAHGRRALQQDRAAHSKWVLLLAEGRRREGA